jgi:hypothetical protein
MKHFVALSFIILLTACAGKQPPDIVYTQHKNLFYPTLDKFPVCRSYGCEKINNASLSKSDKKQIKTIFQSIKTSSEERTAIADAIGMIESIVGNQIGTNVDVAGTYLKFGTHQQDCIDESTNTTTYLILLNQMNLLRFHSINALTSRAPIISGRLGPHRTAVIIENETSTKFAVDSWFHDNGQPAEIVTLETWRWGWHPD